MAKEKILPFVQARSKLSEIVDRVAESWRRLRRLQTPKAPRRHHRH